MSFFSKIFGPSRYLGVDIGTASLKIAEIEHKSGVKPELKNYGYLESFDYLERSNAAFQTSTLHLEERQIASYIRTLMKQSGISPAPVIASLPSFSSFTTLVEMPQLSESEIAQSMKLQAAQYIPVPIENAALDWMKVGERVDEDGTKKLQLFLISVSNEVIARYKNIFKLTGLELKALEIEGLSLARALSSASEETTLIVDIGSRSSVLLVAEHGLPKFLSQTDFAGGSLTQAVATGLGLSERRAEDIKRRRGLTASGGEYELFTVIQPLLDVIINEGTRVIKNYETSYRGKIKKVVLSGGGANLPGLERYAVKEFGLPVAKAKPFSSVVYPESLSPVVGELGPLLSVAIGLGLRV